MGPGDILGKVLKECHIKQSELAREMGISTGRVNAIVRHNKRIEFDTAEKIQNSINSIINKKKDFCDEIRNIELVKNLPERMLCDK